MQRCALRKGRIRTRFCAPSQTLKDTRTLQIWEQVARYLWHLLEELQCANPMSMLLQVRILDLRRVNISFKVQKPH